MADKPTIEELAKAIDTDNWHPSLRWHRCEDGELSEKGYRDALRDAQDLLWCSKKRTQILGEITQRLRETI